jgi:anti-anti-sigma factor
MDTDVQGRRRGHLPKVDGYALTWQGDVLVVHPESWRGPLVGTVEDVVRWQRIVEVAPSTRPRAIVLNLSGVLFLPAVLTGLVVRLGKVVDFTRQRGRLAIVECNTCIREYFRANGLDRFIEFYETESDAVEGLGVAELHEPAEQMSAG